MDSLVAWFMDLSNSKSVGLVIFFITFVVIIIYVYGSKKRSERLETYRNIPFLDEDSDMEPAKHKKQNKQHQRSDSTSK